MLQNSDDAGAKKVEIHFRSEQKQGDSNERNDNEVPDLRNVLSHSWIFKNDGMIFREEDWNRLKKIGSSSLHSLNDT